MGNLVSKERQNSLRSQVVTAVDAVQSNRGLAVTLTLKELKKLPREMFAAELNTRYPNADSHHKLGLSYALAAYGDVDLEYLYTQISRAAPDEVDNLVAAFGASREASLTAIHMLAKAAESEKNWRLKTRYAVVALHLEDDRLAADMCQIHDRSDPIQRTIFIDTFPGWHGNFATLAKYCQARSGPALQSGISLGVGSIPPDLLTDEERAALTPVFKAWHETSPENVIHSSAGWALRAWGVELPPPSSTVEPSDGREWFVNSQGMTLLKIQPGVLVRKDAGDTSNAEPQTVTLTRAFYLSDREITVGQFQRFMDDANYPSEKKPEKWGGAVFTVSPTPNHPIQNVSWFDGVLFCNWLSQNEKRTPCYERTGKKEKINDVFGKEIDVDEWHLVATGTGYRLPTEAEWEYACRAGTTTEFSSGGDVELLRKYATFVSGNSTTASLCGSNLPSGWGLFDMHGNVWEWCQDCYGAYGSDDVRNPVGPSRGSDRVYRGGGWSGDAAYCRTANRITIVPTFRSSRLGFRLALSPYGLSPEAAGEKVAEPSGVGTEGAPAEQRPEMP